jgi:hypothetical protein
MSKEIYEVIEKKGYSGLTVGSKVLKPGQKFELAGWPYGEKALAAAVKDERCKKVSGGEKSKSEKKKEEPKGDK